MILSFPFLLSLLRAAAVVATCCCCCYVLATATASAAGVRASWLSTMRWPTGRQATSLGSHASTTARPIPTVRCASSTLLEVRLFFSSLVFIVLACIGGSNVNVLLLAPNSESGPKQFRKTGKGNQHFHRKRIRMWCSACTVCPVGVSIINCVVTVACDR
jgi:hypothetical protein